MFLFYFRFRGWQIQVCPEFWQIHPAFNHGGFMRCFRKIKTTQERIRFISDIDRQWEYGVKIKVRQKRSANHLPNSFDDYMVKCLDEKGWKRLTKKRKQYLRNVV